MRPYSVVRGAGFIGLFFVVLPGLLIAINERLGWPRWRSGVSEVIGTVLIASGVGVCLYCVWLFWNHGRGTPVPIEPPRRLVTSGLFRFSRHPMYVAYVAIGLGVFLVEGHLVLALYPVVLFCLAELYLAKLEEPDLMRRFGVEYEDYCSQVPRWPRLPLHRPTRRCS